LTRTTSSSSVEFTNLLLVQETGAQEAVARSQAGTMSRSNLPADGTCTTTSAQSASSQPKPSPSLPRVNVGGKLRSPVDGGSYPQVSAGTSTTVMMRPSERLPVYGSAMSDRRSLPPDGSGSDQRSSGPTRPTTTMPAAATAASQVTFQDPLESKSPSYTDRLCHSL